jgi:PAS domain S-box-containing protein
MIEDSELDAGLILRHLEKAGYDITVSRVESEPEMKKALMETWDIILADFQLPAFDAPGALAVLQETGKDIPFIVVSGAVGEETAVSLMKSGARDYVMKDNLSRLPPVIERELIEVEVRRSQKQAHDALMESEQHLRNSQQVAHVGNWIIDLTTGNETWSDEMYRIFGLDPQKIKGDLHRIRETALHPKDKERLRAFAHESGVHNQTGEMECRIIRPDGSTRYILIQSGGEKVDTSGQLIHFTGVVHDITDRKKIELDLREKIIESQNRAQELETITFISSRMRQANNRQELVFIILEELSKMLQADHSAIAFVEGDTLNTNYIMHKQEMIPVNQITTIGKHLKMILDARKIGFFEKIDPHAFNELPAWLYGDSPRPSSMIAYPIVNKNQVMGLIYLDFASPMIFVNEQRSLINTIADMAGNALNRMAATLDLEAMVRLRERELESIYKVTSSASATLDIHRALQQALELTLEAIHISSGAIFLVNGSESKLNLISCQLEEFIPTNFLDQSVIGKILEKVIQQKKSLVIPNVDKFDSKEVRSNLVSGFSMIGLPMRAQDRAVGVLVVIQKNADQIILEEMTLLSFIADHLALVVENSKSYKRAERLAVLEERSRLARELHDSVTQSLYSASLYSAGARKFFSQEKYLEVDNYLTQIGDLTQQALKDMRLLVYELRSPELKHNGLVGALQNRLDAVERRSNIEAEIHMEGIELLPEVIEENLYRIAIESLNNSLKYAQATRITVELTQKNNAVLFTIQDNGVGFSIEEGLKNGGVGLATMRERAERINGTYQIFSSKETGTKIEVRFSIN